MKSYNNQYIVLFCVSWILIYFFIPVWRFINFESFFNIEYPVLTETQKLLITIIYFGLSIYLINHYFNKLPVEKPLFIKVTEWSEHIKNNSGLVIVCFLSLILHIHPLSLDLITTGGGEIPYLRHPAWIYDFINKYWHRFYGFPIQYLYWSVIGLLILIIKQKRMFNPMLNYFKENKSAKYIFISSVIMFIYIYSYLFPGFSTVESGYIRYPPVSRYLYLIIYYTFGISYMGPRILQFMFYILSAVYLYRTICMFNKKETALLGTTIYLFSPLIFSQSSLAMLASGGVLFVILISYYFLRFLKDENNRDLILTAYFIGLGSMYRNEVMSMFIICFTYLLLRKIKNMDWSSTIQFKILFLSLIPILPWMIIYINVYNPIWSNLITFDGLITYSLMIQSQASTIIFILFLFSFGFVLFAKKDDLLLFFGYLFIAYYLFYTIMETAKYDHRYAAPLYPTIAVFIARLIFSTAQRIRWKYTFKLFFSVIAIYLIVLCVIPRSSSSLTTYRYRHHEIQYFPIEKATDWIRNKTGKDEKVVAFLPDYDFYLEKIYKNRHEFSQNKFASARIYKNRDNFSQNNPSSPVSNNEEYTYSVFLSDLKKYCLEENITYFMFAYGPNNIYTSAAGFSEFLKKMKYLHENIGREFTKAAEFSIDDNYIFIYKLKESSIK